MHCNAGPAHAPLGVLPADARPAHFCAHRSLPKEVRSAIVGMLVVFKIEATLPFTILPGLVTSLQKAAAFNLTSAIAQGMQHLQPDNIAKAVATMSAAGQDVMRVLTTNGDPIDLVINAMSNLNMTELLRVLPTVRPGACMHAMQPSLSVTASVGASVLTTPLLPAAVAASTDQCLDQRETGGPH